MSVSRSISHSLSILLFVVAISGSGCNESTEPGAPAGELVDASECKLFLATDEFPQDCIEYEYDGRGKLTVRHINTAFNCCPEYTATIGIETGSLTIVEDETQGLCDCTCLFDLEFSITSLPAGRYSLAVRQEYLEPDDPLHRLELNLGEPTSGEQCIEREGYPWNVPPID